MLRKENNRLIFHYDAEEMWIEPWGADAVRVRATKNCEMPDENWALLKPEDSACSITVSEDGADLVNGKLKVHVTGRGKITMYNPVSYTHLSRLQMRLRQKKKAPYRQTSITPTYSRQWKHSVLR